MIAAVTVLTIVVAVLTVLVAGLLRSHAVILRRLHELGSGVGDDPPAPQRHDDTGDQPDLDLPSPPAVAEGRPAADVSGVGPRGGARAVRVAGTTHDTVLAFLSSGCTTCHAFWDELRGIAPAQGTRIVVVTKGVEAESRAAVADVAPPHLTVVMSSRAWTDYEVPGSPYVVHVDGPSGRVRGEGTGPTWHQVQTMLKRGAADLDARRGRSRKATADAEREEDVDRVLLAAGITPGDPSLYTRADGTGVEPSDPVDAGANGRTT
jgi:hypothetical protein